MALITSRDPKRPDLERRRVLLSKYLCCATSLNRLLSKNSCLYLCFVDFEKAFDSIHRETSWHLLRTYGIAAKLADMIKVIYENFRCAVLDKTGQSEWFDVISGVKQGCVM